jgi:hypothetical protein
MGATMTPPSGCQTATGAAASLEQFSAMTSAAAGVRLPSLSGLDQLEVRTRNSVYQLTILGGGEVMVRGGSFFPEWSTVRLSGSTLGGSLLKMDWIGCGFSMEFLHQGQRIVTTRVREIRKVEPPAGVS